jgi:hypothetical protein
MTMTSTANSPGRMLRFRRDAGSGAYFAEDETKQYVVWKAGREEWRLEVRELVVTADVKHAVGQPGIASSFGDTMGEAVEIAEEYHRLGDDFAEHEHRHQSRMTVAATTVSDRILEQLREGLT